MYHVNFSLELWIYFIHIICHFVRFTLDYNFFFLSTYLTLLYRLIGNYCASFIPIYTKKAFEHVTKDYLSLKVLFNKKE